MYVEPLKSHFADDPDMQDLIEMFVARIPIQIQAMTETLRGHEHPDFVQSVHQLKGTGTLVGFEPISRCAAIIQQHIREGGRHPLDIKDEVEHLIHLCRCARHWARNR